MADTKKEAVTDKSDETSPEGGEEVETQFWARLTDVVSGVVDKIVDDKLKGIRTDDKTDGKPDPGTSRTNARKVTLQTLISDWVYGPPKD